MKKLSNLGSGYPSHGIWIMVQNGLKIGPPPSGPGWKNQPLATVRLFWGNNYFLSVTLPQKHLQNYYVRENLYYWYIG